MQLRLQVILARAGVASRRAAETLIEEGKVSVNGKIVDTLGAKADPERDIITVSGRQIEQNRQSRYILVNKPEGTITSKSDPEGRPTVMALLPKELQELHPVGRLDWATEGVLLFTDDGTMTYALTHPSFEVERVYHVKLKGKLVENDAVKWLEGATLEDGHARAESAEILGSTGKHTWLQITLHEGKNREVRRLAEALGYDVLRLRRHSFAGLTLEDVPPGGYRFLDLDEIERLRYIAKEAGAKIEEKPVASAPEGVARSGQVVPSKGHRGALAFDLTPKGIAPTTQRGTTRVDGFDDEGNPLPKPLPPPKPEEFIGRHGTRTWVSDDAQKQRPARPPREQWVQEEPKRNDWRDRAPEVKERFESRRPFQRDDSQGNDRPNRSFSGERRGPPRDNNRGGFSGDRRGPPQEGDRPRREFNRDARNTDERPRRDFRGEQRDDRRGPPRGDSRGDSRGERPNRDERPRDNNDRPRREFNDQRGPRNDQRGERRGPPRDNDRGERKNFSGERRGPPRSNDRPPRDDQRDERNNNNRPNNKSPRPKHRGPK